MNDQLHYLLDGELSDSETTDYLQHLVGDSGDRTAFRQQIQLHGALYRNSSHDGLSSIEETAMRNRVASAIGGAPSVVPSGFRGGRLAGLVAVILLIGTGLGYVLHGFDQKPVPMPVPAAVVIDFQQSGRMLNHDSLVVAISDSLTRVSSAETVSSAKKPVRSRKKARRPQKDRIVTGVRR